MAKELSEAEQFALRLLRDKYYADTSLWVPYGQKYGMPYEDFVVLATGSSPDALEQHRQEGRPVEQQGSLEHFMIEYIKHAFPADRGGNPDSRIALDIVETSLKSTLSGMIQTWQGIPDGTQQASLFIEDVKADLNKDISAELGKPFP